MNAPVFPRSIGMACRSCGSFNTRMNDKEKPADICVHCWRAYLNWYGAFGKNRKISPTLLNEFFARQLFLSARRLEKYGVTGRCEALSRHSTWLREDCSSGGREHLHDEGYQCGGWATSLRDGRRVCGKHKTGLTVVFESPDRPTQYDVLSGMLAHLASVDPTFKECLQKAALTSHERANG